MNYVARLFATLGSASLWAALADAAAVIAVFFGGIWGYRVYRQKRQRYPRAELKHLVQCVPPGAERMILRVTVNIENRRDVLIRVADGDVRVSQVLPLHAEAELRVNLRSNNLAYEAARCAWPVTWKCEWDNVYSYIGNKEKRKRFPRRSVPLGWKCASYHHLADNDPKLGFAVMESHC